MSHALEATGLGKSFGSRRAVDGVDIALHTGDCLAVFGPNGAGKTTLLKLLAGLLKPSSGFASVEGTPLRNNVTMRGRVGLVSHQSMLYGALTVRENLVFTARLYGLNDPERAADGALRVMGVADRSNSLVRSLSRGLQQRVSVARAIVHEPAVVLLDEPYTGLDESGARALTQELDVLRRQGAALVLVTHNVTEGLTLATHAAIMTRGRFVRAEQRSQFDAQAYLVSYREVVSASA